MKASSSLQVLLGHSPHKWKLQDTDFTICKMYTLQILSGFPSSRLRYTGHLNAAHASCLKYSIFFTRLLLEVCLFDFVTLSTRTIAESTLSNSLPLVTKSPVSLLTGGSFTFTLLLTSTHILSSLDCYYSADDFSSSTLCGMQAVIYVLFIKIVALLLAIACGPGRLYVV